MSGTDGAASGMPGADDVEMDVDEEEEEEDVSDDLDGSDDLDEDDDYDDDDEEDDDDVEEDDMEDMDDDDDVAGMAPPEEPPAPPAEADAALARRRRIQEIMRNPDLTQDEKNRAIQDLMSGGRTHVPQPPAPAVAAAAGDGANGAAPEASAACVHYERNCSIVAPCCDRVFGCRICHDELSPTGHAPMNRFHVREVVCKNCGTRQAASNQCISCQTVFGEYHCSICNLWMSMSKKPFHCAQCGFCRVGGVEAFRHCAECCMCISVSVFGTHQCFRDKYKNNCPVCREDMFSSRQSPQDLPCGHAIHAHCFRKLAGFDYRCPICKKTVVSQQSMAAAWEARARDIAEHPMPPDLQRIVDIMCNDCETKSANRDWHFLGIQCPRCNSFNTVVEQVVSVAATAQQGPPGANGSAASGSA